VPQLTGTVCKSSIQIFKTLFSATTLGRLCKLDPSFVTTLLLVTIQHVWLALSTDLAQHYQLVDFNGMGAVGHGSWPGHQNTRSCIAVCALRDYCSTLVGAAVFADRSSVTIALPS
jgi:hypothetical protein